MGNPQASFSLEEGGEWCVAGEDGAAQPACVCVALSAVVLRGGGIVWGGLCSKLLSQL